VFKVPAESSYTNEFHVWYTLAAVCLALAISGLASTAVAAAAGTAATGLVNWDIEVHVDMIGVGW